MSPKVYVIVLNYQNYKDTIDCVQSLRKLTYTNYHIIVVDNNSCDESKEKLSHFVENDSNTTFLALEKNWGYAGGNNRGMEYAMRQGDMEYCWILNNDTIVTPEALSCLVDKMEAEQDLGICGSKLIYEWDRNQLQGYGGRYNPWLGTSWNCKDLDKIHQIDYVIGASVLVRKRFLEIVGFMSEEYFLYFEELDWYKRAEGKYRISCAPESIVYHKEGASTGGSSKEARSELADYFILRNRILFTQKYYPYCLPIVYIGLFGSLCNRLGRKQWRHAARLLKIVLGRKEACFEMLICGGESSN